MHTPQSPIAPQGQTPVEQAAEALRRLALNEQAKELFCHHPQYRAYMHRVARRYVAGRTIDDALECALAITARGHAVSLEYTGESVRDALRANAEAEVFLALIAALDARRQAASISLDLSHVGSLVDPELAYQNICRIARAAAAQEREVMISAEGSDRADVIHAIYIRLHEEAKLHHVGITLQARLHRAASDLARLMPYPGRIRLVKGAFLESTAVAWPRNSTQLQQSFRHMARELLASGQRCAIATHDREIQQELAHFITQRHLEHHDYEFESLIGLGTEQIDSLQRQGLRTREYAIFGEEYFLYVLNRIAEEPTRLFQALLDITDGTSGDTAPA